MGTDGKLFAYATANIHDRRFIFNGYEYMFSKRDDRFEIRKLSNTYNANVIFSIQNDPTIQGLSDDEFISCLK